MKNPKWHLPIFGTTKTTQNIGNWPQKRKEEHKNVSKLFLPMLIGLLNGVLLEGKKVFCLRFGEFKQILKNIILWESW